MVRKVLANAGYTAVGLGVLAAQQVQVRRRETRAKAEAQVRDARRRVESLVGEVRKRVPPVAGELVERLPRPPVPGPVSQALNRGRARLRQMLP